MSSHDRMLKGAKWDAGHVMTGARLVSDRRKTG
jgi:hypothetical protein